MGVDISCYAERLEAGRPTLIEGVSFFDWRSYALYGWLADVRNYSAVAPISEPRGLPDDLSEGVRRIAGDDCWCYATSWLTLEELEAVDYDAEVEDRRVARRTSDGWIDGSQTCDPGKGQRMPLREFLGVGFFDELARLKSHGAHRIVFWFDV